jgi:hypothetical protein
MSDLRKMELPSDLWAALHEWREAVAGADSLGGTDFSDAAVVADQRVLASIAKVESLFAALSGGGSPPTKKLIQPSEEMVDAVGTTRAYELTNGITFPPLRGTARAERGSDRGGV